MRYDEYPYLVHVWNPCNVHMALVHERIATNDSSPPPSGAAATTTTNTPSFIFDLNT